MLTTNAATPLGRAQLGVDLCALEFLGHRRMLAELEVLLEEVRLTPAQARAVCDEIQARRVLIEATEKQRSRAYTQCSYHRRVARDYGRSLPA